MTECQFTFLSSTIISYLKECPAQLYLTDHCGIYFRTGHFRGNGENVKVAETSSLQWIIITEHEIAIRNAHSGHHCRWVGLQQN